MKHATYMLLVFFFPFKRKRKKNRNFLTCYASNIQRHSEL